MSYFATEHDIWLADAFEDIEECDHLYRHELHDPTDGVIQEICNDCYEVIEEYSEEQSESKLRPGTSAAS